MKVTENKNAEIKEKTKEELIELLERNKIPYSITECCGCERVCIAFNENTACKKLCFDSAINVLTCSKDICRIYAHDILFIGIENRKSVLYLTDRRIETRYPINYWKSILDENIFAQPHYSYIVNLNYVDEVTKDFVKIKCGKKEYSVYTSSRKIRPFKKAFLNFK